MFRFLETICVLNGQIQRLAIHEERISKTFHDHNAPKRTFTLNECIKAPSYLSTGRVKCRIVYTLKGIQKIEYIPYIQKQIKTIKPVITSVNYSYKYEDRSQLEIHYLSKGLADDVLFVKNGFITDSFYGNIALLKNGIWYTPLHPLLKGTMRSFLIRNKMITPIDISINEIYTFERISLFNAMIDFLDVNLPIQSVLKIK